MQDHSGGKAPGPSRSLPSLPAEEFAARRARVLDAIGGGIAVLQGAPAPPGFSRFRQSNEFHYLTGVARPHAYVLLDGQSGRSTLYLPEPVPGEAAPDGWPERVAPAGRLAADLAAHLRHGN